MSDRVVQIAIERGHDVDGAEVTALWALTEAGRIWVEVRGTWTEQQGPPGTLKIRKRRDE